MAVGDTEIEIKTPVDKKTFERVKIKLEKTSRFIHKSHHIDTYYNPIHVDFIKHKVPYKWLSIRARNGTTILNFKHWYKNKDGEFTHCDEYETKIDKKDQIEKIFVKLDIVKISKVDKTRWKFKVDDKFEVCLDFVCDLGYFVEIETIKDFPSVAKARESLFAYAKSLGLDPSIEVPGGYAFQLMKKK